MLLEGNNYMKIHNLFILQRLACSSIRTELFGRSRISHDDTESFTDGRTREFVSIAAATFVCKAFTVSQLGVVEIVGSRLTLSASVAGAHGKSTDNNLWRNPPEQLNFGSWKLKIFLHGSTGSPPALIPAINESNKNPLTNDFISTILG